MNDTSEFEFGCPHCGQHRTADGTMVGMTLDCPACGRPFQVPAPESPEMAVPVAEESAAASAATPPPPISPEPSAAETTGNAKAWKGKALGILSRAKAACCRFGSAVWRFLKPKIRRHPRCAAGIGCGVVLLLVAARVFSGGDEESEAWQSSRSVAKRTIDLSPVEQDAIGRVVAAQVEMQVRFSNIFTAAFENDFRRLPSTIESLSRSFRKLVDDPDMEKNMLDFFHKLPTDGCPPDFVAAWQPFADLHFVREVRKTISDFCVRGLAESGSADPRVAELLECARDVQRYLAESEDEEKRLGKRLGEVAARYGLDGKDIVILSAKAAMKHDSGELSDEEYFGF